MRVRGLKRTCGNVQVTECVAPYAGAWIETLTVRDVSGRRWSHPMRVRGLKLALQATNEDEAKSHPMRVRGLKRPPTTLIMLQIGRTLCGCVD